MSNDGRFLTVDQLADFLKAKPKTIRNWVHKKQIPFIKIKGLLRFDRHRIESWILSQEKK